MQKGVQVQENKPRHIISPQRRDGDFSRDGHRQLRDDLYNRDDATSKYSLEDPTDRVVNEFCISTDTCFPQNDLVGVHQCSQNTKPIDANNDVLFRSFMVSVRRFVSAQEDYSNTIPSA